MSPHEAMGWVVLTLIFVLAGNELAALLAELLKLEPPHKMLLKTTFLLITMGNLVAIILALILRSLIPFYMP